MSSPILTTGHGAPVDDTSNSLTIGVDGPILLQDVALIDKLAHFDRERIPERVVHARGSLAHGYFEVTHDIKKYTKAKFLNSIGKRTPVAVRFSTVGGERGSAETVRDPRGFAIKHYTEDGIFDMVGNNTPIFFIRDPQMFPDFIHTQKRCPDTGIGSPDMVWDFASLVPETIHQFGFLFSDRGIPYGYRHMNGYSSHALKWINQSGDQYWVKLHYKTDAGIKNLSVREARELAGSDPDFSTRDLFNHIKSGKLVSWTAYVQIMPISDTNKYKYNPFDVTKVWLQKDYPLIPYGKLVLNRNPENYFAEVEQAAFAPSHMVPGIEPSLDRMLQARLFSYADTQRHRLGANVLQIPINSPYVNKVANFQRDGPQTFVNPGAAPVYFPNSLPVSASNPQPSKSGITSPHQISGIIGRYKHSHPNDDFEQPRLWYNQVLKEEERVRLIENLVGSISGARKEVQIRMIELFMKVDKDYGRRVGEGLRKAAGGKL